MFVTRNTRTFVKDLFGAEVVDFGLENRCNGRGVKKGQRDRPEEME